MADMDAFERNVAKGLLRLADDVAGTVDAAAVAHRVALEHPRNRAGTLAWGSVAVPRLAWVLLAAGLLLALGVGGLVAGGWRPDQAVVIAPSPPPARTMTVFDEAADVLATTKAKPLPPQATCPPGSDPDALGPADQDRPTGGDMAFDRHAGRIVLLATDERDPYGRAATWTFDACANTWQRMSPAVEPPVGGQLIYDADSDRTLEFTEDGIWVYDLTADRWTMAGSIPGAAAVTPDSAGNPTYGTTFYHDPSGLVVLYDGATMWAYDVDTNTLAKVRQLPDPSRPAAAGLPAGKIAFGFDVGRDVLVAVVVPYTGGPGIAPDMRWGVPSSPWGETWAFDPGSGAWRLKASPAPSDLIVCAYWKASTDCLPTNGRAVFDGASGLPVFFNRDNGGQASAHATPGRIDAYDASADAWRTLRAPVGADSAKPNWCESMPPVYDPVNRRIVCLSSAGEPIGVGVTYPYAGLWAFSTSTGESTWLLEPSATSPPVPTLAPGATPIDWGTPPPGWPQPSAAPSVAP